MIADPLTRRSVVIGGLLVTATLSGCSVSELTTRKIEDPQAADRGRIAQALALSVALRRDIRGSAIAGAEAGIAADLRALHDVQIAQFERSAGLTTPIPTGATTSLGIDELGTREHGLAQSFRGLALDATSGQVAALLASAAAGIDQVLAR